MLEQLLGVHAVWGESGRFSTKRPFRQKEHVPGVPPHHKKATQANGERQQRKQELKSNNRKHCVLYLTYSACACLKLCS